MTGDAWDEAQAEIVRLRAEVAALREERSNLRAAARECRDHCVCAANAERDLATARASLYEAVECLKTVRMIEDRDECSSRCGEVARSFFKTHDEDGRAFLARGKEKP